MMMGTMGRVERLRRFKPERCPVATSPVRRVEITPEVERQALAAAVVELPGRSLVTERAAAVELRLAGLEVKPGSLAEARGLPNTPRIRHPLG
jgi:hypothetical protein